MPKFGKRSRERLATCDERLQEVFNEVIKFVDCSVLEGHRSQERQDQLYIDGKTKVKYPNGRHNSKPSRAVDVVPYPIKGRWKEYERFAYFAGYVLGTAKQMGVKLIWGNDWNGDFEIKDTDFKDRPHFELGKEE